MASSADPSEKIRWAGLKWHLHLVSSYKCENKGDVFSFDNEQIKDLLLDAALEKDTTTRSPSAWCWQKLATPRDRKAIVTWQSAKLPVDKNFHVPPDHFPTDGYAWADPEEARKEQLGDYTLEIRKHRSGFIPATDRIAPFPKNTRRLFVPGIEAFTTHSRIRYRLTSNAAPKDGETGPDPNLWLILYKRADRGHVLRVDNEAVQINAQSQIPALKARAEIFDVAADLKARGPQWAIADRWQVFDRGYDIKQKGFVWANSDSWPSIQEPPKAEVERSMNNHLQRSQQSLYMAGQQIIDPRGGPASKRARNNHGLPVPVVPEGEDEGGKDFMDVLTPRDLSLIRYRQHTEWMDELFTTPFPIHKMLPVGLGLGRTGMLSDIGKDLDFVDAPVSAEDEFGIKKPSADEYKTFVKQTEDKIAEMQADMEKDKARHERRMAKIRQSGAIQEAERKLRSAVQFPSHANSKVERPESAHAREDKNTDVAMLRQVDDIKTIAQEVETSLGRNIIVIEQAKCVSRGGLEDKAPTPVQDDIVMDGMDGSLQTGQPQAPEGFPDLDGMGEGAPQAQPDDSLVLPDEDFDMGDRDILGDGSVGDAVLPTATEGGVMPGDLAAGETGTPGKDFGAEFLDLPDDNLGETPGDDFAPSAFDDAFDGADTMQGDEHAMDQPAQ